MGAPFFSICIRTKYKETLAWDQPDRVDFFIAGFCQLMLHLRNTR